VYYKEAAAMMVTLRLDEDTARKVELLTKRLGVSRSEVVRKSLLRLVEQSQGGNELVSRLESLTNDLPGSGDGNLSVAGRREIGARIKKRALR
jgi:Arc/MetJ-type ribon-helix-helix transcriptional regulator